MASSSSSTTTPTAASAASASSSPPLGQISGGGSTGWETHVTRLFDAMREEHPDVVPAPFDKLDEETVCSQPLHATFAFYLTNDYVIRAGHKNHGQHLSVDTVKMAVRNLIRLGRQRFPNHGKSHASPSRQLPPLRPMPPRRRALITTPRRHLHHIIHHRSPRARASRSP